ncbi:Aminomethyltransferase folate-Hypothetical protein domain [Nesidiocoris tenuis]|nr:Aminomethyltransferase folate-Hypothetical protein domain [Nesidiocoris tenuis]
MVLNSKGRVLYDGFLYSTGSADRFLIECSTEAADPLIKHLRTYSLRKKIEICKSELLPWAVFGNSVSNDCLVADPRCREPWLYRCLSESQPCPTIEDGSYTKLRYSLGIAEGFNEIPVGEAFPLEYNADFLNGVSFEKGCYVGQELTARVHHTGVIRKRIMPLELDNEPPHDCNLDDPVVDSESGKTVGKIRGVHQNRVLALMRITETLSSKRLVWGGINARAAIPTWWPPLQKETAKRN